MIIGLSFERHYLIKGLNLMVLQNKICRFWQILWLKTVDFDENRGFSSEIHGF